jgi:hypothetical protein
VVHACNPSYSEGRDQKDCGSKPAQANSSRDPISKKPFTKIELVEWLKVKALSSSPSTTKKKRKKEKKINMLLHHSCKGVKLLYQKTNTAYS